MRSSISVGVNSERSFELESANDYGEAERQEKVTHASRDRPRTFIGLGLGFISKSIQSVYSFEVS